MKLIPWRNKDITRSDAGITPTLDRFRDSFEDLFRRFWSDAGAWGLTDSTGRTWGIGPRMDMSETETELTLRFEVPGVKAEDLDIRVSGDVLTIEGEKKEQSESKRGGAVYSERSFGRFTRSVTLPSTVDSKNVSAVCKDGVLTVTLQKRPEAKPRRVAVRNA